MVGESIDLSTLILGAGYSRAEIAIAGNVAVPVGPRDPQWSTGIVMFDNAVLLLVTLEKKEYTYVDYFDGTLFWWQSQSRQTRESKLIRQLVDGELDAHLFVRQRAKAKSGKAEPFSYAGALSRPDVEGDNPVTAVFGLLDYRPDESGPLGSLYRWRHSSAAGQADLAIRKRSIEARQASGQGRQADTKLRRATELYAMKRAIEHYSRAGWVVADTSARYPFDLLCSKKGAQRRVEVKGTQSVGDVVLVTIGEVSAARSLEVPTDLFIVHGIVVTKVSGDYVLSGGDLRLIENWLPEDKRLRAIAFEYSAAL